MTRTPRSRAHWAASAAQWAALAERARDALAHGRAVVVLAAALAALDAARTGSRGRRPVGPARVAAAMAVDAERGSGRRTRPGRMVAAAAWGLDRATITRGIARLEAVGWCERTAQGRATSWEERCRTGQRQHRAEWDIHRMPHRLAPVEAIQARLEDAQRLLQELAHRAAQLAAEVAAETAAASVPATPTPTRPMTAQTPSEQGRNFAPPPQGGVSESRRVLLCF